jgi:transcriptional regulator with XRE-family HTH domain
MSATRTRPSPKTPTGVFDALRFGACLKERRIAKSMTLQDLSHRTGFSVSAISEMENGQKATFPKAAGVCAALGVRLSRVLLDAERRG